MSSKGEIMATGIMPDWEEKGFAGTPSKSKSTGTEFVFRCYSRNPKRPISINIDVADTIGSGLYGNCFFVPKISCSACILNSANIDRKKRWTWTYLEKQLNAWFWGNDYQRVAMFQLGRNVSYWIGPIGQDTRANTGSITGIQRHLAWPGVTPELLQVVLDVTKIEEAITLVEDWAVPGAPMIGSQRWN